MGAHKGDTCTPQDSSGGVRGTLGGMGALRGLEAPEEGGEQGWEHPDERGHPETNGGTKGTMERPE